MMNSFDIVRTWKEYQHRVSLIGEDLTQLPQDSSAVLELTDAELVVVNAGWGRGWGDDEDDERWGRFGSRGRFGRWGDRDDWWRGGGFGCGY